ncbi:hypothetical protein D1AOALGA4SA_13135 [Olavius algarvensis Delta 1 endosymbiont]|nr:hypothetical protein D1AOALGA4SA_13135 [Olavius algarvensis Delta 1 endosymbiont]
MSGFRCQRCRRPQKIDRSNQKKAICSPQSSQRTLRKR